MNYLSSFRKPGARSGLSHLLAFSESAECANITGQQGSLVFSLNCVH